MHFRHDMIRLLVIAWNLPLINASKFSTVPEIPWRPSNIPIRSNQDVAGSSKIRFSRLRWSPYLDLKTVLPSENRFSNVEFLHARSERQAEWNMPQKTTDYQVANSQVVWTPSIQTFHRSMQNSSSNVIRPIDKMIMAVEDEDSLRRLLTAIVTRDLQECDLIILVDNSFEKSPTVQVLLRFPNFKEITLLQSASPKLGNQVSWKSPRCQGIVVLVTDQEILTEFGNQAPTFWDYRARVVIAGVKKEGLELFLHTMKGRKTEQIIGIVKGDGHGIFKIFMNKLYSAEKVSQITTWTQDSFTKKSTLFPDKISNLQQTVLNVVVFEWKPVIIYRWNEGGQLLERYGRDIDVVKALADVFNFTYVFVETDPRELFGQPLPNGSYNGMVGLLGSGQGDLAIANLWIIAHEGRDAFQEFSTPFAGDKSCCLARVDPPLPLWQSPGLPFQLITWIVIFAGLMLAGPLLYLLANGSRKSGSEASNLGSLLWTSLNAFGVHFSHPMANLPKRSSTRVFIAFLWMYSIILTTGYKSNLTAFLTIQRQPDSIETFSELHKAGLMVLGIPFFKSAMETSGNQYLRALKDRYDVRMRFEETEEDILAGRAVTINSNIYLEMYGGEIASSSSKPSYRIMKECFGHFAVAIAYQKNSLLKPNFDRIITWIFESGLPRKWFLTSLSAYQRLQTNSADKAEIPEEVDGVIPLGLEHMQGVFILWAFGSTLSVALFIGEILLG